MWRTDTPVDVLIVAAAAESVTALQLVGSFADAAKGAISATFIEELTPLPGNVEHLDSPTASRSPRSSELWTGNRSRNARPTPADRFLTRAPDKT